MPEAMTVSLGGIVIALIPDKSGGRFDILKKIGDFSTTEKPDIVLNVHCGTAFPEIVHEKLLFDTNLSWYMTEDDQLNRIVKVRSPYPDPYILARFNKDYRSGDIFVSSSPKVSGTFVFPFGFPIAELFMMSILGTGLGLLFHATGIIYEGKGHLFVGHGGIGKTTTARLWQNQSGALVVNDDKVIVRSDSNHYRMYGTPWHGDGGMALPESAPLERIFILRQADHNTARELSKAEAVAMLLARCFMPLWDDKVVDFSLEFLEGLVDCVPCCELGVVPDQSAVEFVLDLEKELVGA